jgi:DNA-binding CsgD family transcriptional regulator
MSGSFDELEEPSANTELSERELQILKLLATGLSNKEIASQLYLSINTVKVHLRNIFAKLGVQSRTEATLVAIQRGYVDVPGTPATEAVEGNEAAEAIGSVDQSIGTRTVADRVPAIEIEPPLPIQRRIALIGMAVLAIGLALIAVPRGSAQGSGAAQPFSDSPNPGAVVPVTAGSSDWQQVTQMAQARGRLAAAQVRSQIVAIGGESSGGITGQVDLWDIGTQAWSTGANKPTPVANIGAVVISDTIIVPGGYTAAGTPTAVVEAYHPLSDTWSTLAPLPAPRFAYAIAAYHDKVYVFGGWDGSGYANTVFIYDPATARWTSGTPMLLGRGFAGAATLNDAIYVVGGYANDHEFDRCDRYLPQEDRWEECAPMSVARGGLSLIPAGGRLYAIGGGWTGYHTFNERYDPATNSWSVLPTPFTGQWRGMGATSRGNDIYALGGWNGQYLNTVEKYNPFPFNIFVPAATR